MRRRSLLTWYRRSRRDLPWRATRDPYRIWVSEVMLQQTQVATARPYYEAFLRRFPTLGALAELGVRRVSAGSGIALAVAGLARRAAERFLQGGRYDTMLEGAMAYGEMNALFRQAERMGDRL